MNINSLLYFVCVWWFPKGICFVTKQSPRQQGIKLCCNFFVFTTHMILSSVQDNEYSGWFDSKDMFLVWWQKKPNLSSTLIRWLHWSFQTHNFPTFFSQHSPSKTMTLPPDFPRNKEWRCCLRVSTHSVPECVEWCLWGLVDSPRLSADLEGRRARAFPS